MTVPDALCAYIIDTINKLSKQLSNDYFQRVYILIYYWDLSDSLASATHVDSSFIIMLISDFPDPFSLASILLR